MTTAREQARRAAFDPQSMRINTLELRRAGADAASDVWEPLLRALVEHEADPCMHDHHGDCQTHNAGSPCAVRAARDALGLP